jgi:DNA-binding response OmpR family regulator
VAHIFVIDDDEQLLRMVGLMLERGGHITTLLNNPLEGLERIKADEPDLVVLDVMMPHMNGHDVTRQIRNTSGLEDLPILILTARSQEIDRTTALKSGANGYLSKPVTAQELLTHVDDLLVKQVAAHVPDQGIILALYGMRGGTGRTTIAVNLAAALRHQSRQEVCLLELGVSGGQAALHLRLQTRSHWLDLQQVSNLNWPAVKSHMTSHQSGMRLLASPPSPQPPVGMPADTVASMLDILLKNMTFIVVDMPGVLNDSFRAVMERADMALHLVAPDVVALQTAVNTNRTLSQAGIKPRYKSHILNQPMPTAPLSNSAVERGLNTRIAFHIEYDRNQPRALTQGVPLTLTPAKSPLPTVVRRMADVLWQRVTNPT